MIVKMEKSLADLYGSKSQAARVVTEDWVEKNMFCVRCGNIFIKHFENNRPVADFFCPQCAAQYELKSKSGLSFGKKISDGAYVTMIERITGNENPDFMFMNYSLEDMSVRNFFIVPKHFFVPEIIEKRNPLSPQASRKGWIGCNILFEKIPEQGKICVIENGKARDAKAVVSDFKRSCNLAINDIKSRSWLFDTLACVNLLPEHFTLSQMYTFESILQSKHPENSHVKAKIRQQLQFLRDKGYIVFLGDGVYRKI